MNMHKICCHQELLLLAQICIKSFVGWCFAPDPTGELTALPQTPQLFRGGARETEGVEGTESRNAQIQSWQA